MVLISKEIYFNPYSRNAVAPKTKTHIKKYNIIDFKYFNFLVKKDTSL